MTREFIIGTRGSDLALWQANTVRDMLARHGYTCSLKIIQTKGDAIQNLSFDKMEGKGFFTKEIEEALQKNEIDIAVHSHKDLETNFPPDLTIGAVSEREEPNDLLLVRKEVHNPLHPYGLKKGARIGTSALRRKSLVQLFFPDAGVSDLRGNVPTRVQKLKEGLYDAVILAKAGVKRLNLDLSSFETYTLPAPVFVPAAAQGVLALQCRKKDNECLDALKKIHSTDAERTVWMEREILHRLEGGCLLPVGVHVSCADGLYSVHGLYAPAGNMTPKRIFLQGADADALVRSAVEKLKSKSAYSSVLLSRSAEDSRTFTHLLTQNGIKVEHSALTRYEAVPFAEVPPCDWIFFSSRQCVNFFFGQKPVLPKGIKFGTIGGATTEVLKTFGHTATFSGYGSDTREVGKGFAQLAGNARVLFPQSTGSYRTVQKQFNNQTNLIELVVYDTLPVEDIVIPATDVVVLTSPTNAILYLRQKPANHNPVYVAMGKSTAEILQQHGITNVILPWNSSEIALADAVLSL